MKILVVDDEKDICEILQYNLENEGYEVTTVNSAESALKLDITEYGLILLDVMMNDISGFQMAEILKGNSATAQIPVIFITALDDVDNTVKGLSIGADDYIAKPLSMKEVKARVNAVLRRVANSQIHRISNKNVGNVAEVRYEDIVLNLDAKTATMEGIDLPLTKLEFELLSLFLQNPGKTFCRDELMKCCWPQDVCVLDRTVDVNITRLRKKVGRYGKQIKTRVGYGYCFEM